MNLCSAQPLFYLQVVEIVSSVQVDAFGLLVDGHHGQADVQRTVKFPSLDLKQQQRFCYSSCFWSEWKYFRDSILTLAYVLLRFGVLQNSFLQNEVSLKRGRKKKQKKTSLVRKFEIIKKKDLKIWKQMLSPCASPSSDTSSSSSGSLHRSLGW